MDLLCLTCDASVILPDNVFLLSWLYNLFTRFIEKGLRSQLQKKVRTLFSGGLLCSFRKVCVSSKTYKGVMDGAFWIECKLDVIQLEVTSFVALGKQTKDFCFSFVSENVIVVTCSGREYYTHYFCD